MTQRKKKPAVTKQDSEVDRLRKDIAALGFLVGDLATRVTVLEARPTRAPSWWRTFLLGADSDAG